MSDPKKRHPLNRFFSPVLRVFFRLLYNQLAWSYDWVAAIVSVGMWKGWVLAVLPYLTGPLILEIGHGPGHLQVAISQKGLQPVGLDASRYMGRQAFKRVKRIGRFPWLVNGYAQLMPFESASFQQVVATFPSDYFIQPHTLIEIHRVLSPGGDLFVIPAAWITGQNWYYRLAAWLFRFTGQVPDLHDPGVDKQILDRFSQAGFVVNLEQITLLNSTLLLIHAQKQIKHPHT